VRLAGAGRVAAGQVVVAAGPWSAALLRPLGYRPPLGSERGTSRHYRACGNAVLNTPILDVAGGYVLSPMAAGLRLTTGAEFAGRDRPQRFRQLARAEAAARQVFPLDAPADAAPWAGSRPSLPDGRPAIGAVPGRPGYWCAFGHGHIGVSSGPASGRLLAALMAGRPPPFEAMPFDPGRFG
jgi:D-amino-acid dehydrogenase